MNQVTLGATRTPIWSLIVSTEDAEKELEQRVSRSIPLGRFSEADEVAKAGLYLTSDDSASVSGSGSWLTEAPPELRFTGVPERLLANSKLSQLAGVARLFSGGSLNALERVTVGW